MIKISLSASFEYPVLLVYGVVLHRDEVVTEIPHYYPYHGILGKSYNRKYVFLPTSDEFTLKLRWYSISENQYFAFDSDFGINGSYDAELIIGLYSKGKVVIWEYSDTKSVLLFTGNGVDATIDTQQIFIENPSLIRLLSPTGNSIAEIKSIYEKYNQSIINSPKLLNSYHGDIPSYDFDHKYVFRYVVSFGSMTDDGINMVFEVSNTDGTFDKRLSKELFEYNIKSCPRKIKILTLSGLHNVNYYIWFQTGQIIQLFHKFYVTHPEAKADFIIRIDAENKKYELALYRQGLKEPVVIPESAYQLIVFKNKFEDYRSENYNQPRGAWIW